MNIKYSSNLIFLIFLLIPFFKPVGLAYFTIVDNVFKIWKFISMIIIIYIIIKKILKNKKIHFDKNFIGLYIFWVIDIINCIIYHTNALDILSNAISAFLIFELINYEYKEDRKKDLLNALEIIFTIYLIIHIFTVFYINITQNVIFQPIGDDYIYFLGTDNYSAFQIIPMLSIIIYNNYSRKNKILEIKNILLMIMIIICNLYTKSYTAAFASIILFLIVIFNEKLNKILKILSIKKIIAIYCLLLVLILGFNVQNIFANVLENGIGKGVTLNSRTIIWNNAIQLIGNKWLFGYGTLSDQMIKSYALFGAGHAHNFLIEIALRTGIVGAVAYITFLIKMNSKKDLSNKRNILYEGLLVYLILSFMDFYPNILCFYLLIGVLYYSNMNKNEGEVINENRNSSIKL